jgi:hypothetical protein
MQSQYSHLTLRELELELRLTHDAVIQWLNERGIEPVRVGLTLAVPRERVERACAAAA